VPYNCSLTASERYSYPASNTITLEDLPQPCKCLTALVLGRLGLELQGL
jgi:hypothetical protein